jgi:hypothetical protein
MARCEHALDHPRDRMNVVPIGRDFLGRQTRKVRNVPVSKDDDRMTRGDRMALQVSVACGSDIKRLAELVPTKPATHASFPGIPVVRPRSCHQLAFAEREIAQRITHSLHLEPQHHPARETCERDELFAETGSIDISKLRLEVPRIFQTDADDPCNDADHRALPHDASVVGQDDETPAHQLPSTPSNAVLRLPSDYPVAMVIQEERH